MLLTNYHDRMHLDILRRDLHFPRVTPPIVAKITGTIIMRGVDGHVDPQNSRQARSLSDSAKWIATEHDDIHSIADNNVIKEPQLLNTLVSLQLWLCCVYALKWTPENTTDCAKSCCIVRGFLKISDVNDIPLAVHEHVALGSSLHILISHTLKLGLHRKQTDTRAVFHNFKILR